MDGYVNIAASGAKDAVSLPTIYLSVLVVFCKQVILSWLSKCLNIKLTALFDWIRAPGRALFFIPHKRADPPQKKVSTCFRKDTHWASVHWSRCFGWTVSWHSLWDVWLVDNSFVTNTTGGSGKRITINYNVWTLMCLWTAWCCVICVLRSLCLWMFEWWTHHHLELSQKWGPTEGAAQKQRNIHTLFKNTLERPSSRQSTTLCPMMSITVFSQCDTLLTVDCLHSPLC